MPITRRRLGKKRDLFVDFRDAYARGIGPCVVLHEGADAQAAKLSPGGDQLYS